jgi:hypothetical protein
MRTTKTLISIVLFLLLSGSVNAQYFRFGLTGYSGMAFGDMNYNLTTDKAYDDVIFSAGGNFEFQFVFKNNLAVGLRFDYASYERDADAFNQSLVDRFGITDSNYISQRAYLYSSYSTQIGASYILSITNAFQIEPYFYMGSAWFTTPFEHTVFYNSKKNRTYTYRKDKQLYLGFHYTPGVKFQVNLGKHFGINGFVEYKGIALGDQVEETTLYSADTFIRYNTAHSYNVSALNYGIGVNFRFGTPTAE